MNTITIRPAIAEDALGMSDLLGQILTIWGSERPSDPDHMQKFYIKHPDRIQCLVAINKKGEIIGFQSLKRAPDDNIYGVTPDWGIIGTYVKPNSGRRGIGSALFENSLQAARREGLKNIDATISKANQSGLNYYNAMGFISYRTSNEAISKCYSIVSPNT